MKPGLASFYGMRENSRQKLTGKFRLSKIVTKKGMHMET